MLKSRQILEYIKEKAEKMADQGYSYSAHLLDDLAAEIEHKFCRSESNTAPPATIGDKVYAVIAPSLPIDPPAYIEEFEIYGAGYLKDGTPIILNEDAEIFKLDDEEEGFSFSTREKAENYLKGLEEK